MRLGDHPPLAVQSSVAYRKSAKRRAASPVSRALCRASANSPSIIRFSRAFLASPIT